MFSQKTARQRFSRTLVQKKSTWHTIMHWESGSGQGMALLVYLGTNNLIGLDIQLKNFGR
jgi:hypothetical protein